MLKITDQELIKQVYNNCDVFSTLTISNSLFLIESFNKCIIEHSVNSLLEMRKESGITLSAQHQYFNDIFDYLGIKPNSIRIKIESSSIYFSNCAFLWRVSESRYIEKNNLDCIKASIESGILSFDPVKQLSPNEEYLTSDFIDQPVIIFMPKKIVLPQKYANLHFKLESKESFKYIKLLNKLWTNPEYLKNADSLSIVCVLFDLCLQRLYTLCLSDPDCFLIEVLNYFNKNCDTDIIELTHPFNLILGYIFNIDGLKRDLRFKFLLELINSKNSLTQAKSCLEKYGVTLINETLP